MLAFLAQRWLLCALVAGVSLALSVPHAFHVWTSALPPPFIIATSLFIVAWTMPHRSLADEVRRPWAALWALAISYGLVPAAGWALGVLAPLPDVRVGLMLAASVPCTLASGVLWTRLAGGNEATTLLTVVGSTLSSWFVTTFWIAVATRTHAEVPVLDMMLVLALTLVVPVVLGQGLRSSISAARFADRHKAPLSALAQVCVLAIVVKASAAVGLQIHEGDAVLGLGTLLSSALLALGLHLLGLYAGLWSSALWGFDRPRCLAVAFAGSQKTLPISLTLFHKYFETDFALAIIPLLFYHVGQLLLDTLIAERMKRQTGPAEVVEAL
jgi:sodium/bile acid cotransporter 7